MTAAATPPSAASADVEGFRRMQASSPIQQLRERRRPVLTVTGVLVGLYLVNAILANWAPGFMDAGLVGPVNVGLLLGLVQGITTVWAAWWYGRYARRRLDPLAEPLRDSIEQWEGDR